MVGSDAVSQTQLGYQNVYTRGVLPLEDVAQSSAVTGTITANAQTITVATSAFNGAVFAWWGTFAGINLSFEACYEPSLTNWTAVGAVAIYGGTPVTSVSNQSVMNAYNVYAPGAEGLRVRSTAYTSGTMNVRAIPVSMMQEVISSVAGGSMNVIGIVSNGTGGLATVNRLLSAAASVNATVAKASAGRIYKILGYNAAASLRYLKLYNKATAPTVGTDTPVVTIPLSPSLGFNIDLGLYGEYFSAGISYGLTTGVADNDTGALTAADIVGLNIWFA